MPSIVAALTLLFLLMAPVEAAAPPPDLTFRAGSSLGPQSLAGDLTGLRIHSGSASPQAAFTGFSPLLHLETVNSTADTVLGAAPSPENGGVSRDLADASVASGAARPGVDLLIVPLNANQLPRITASASRQEFARSPVGELREIAYVNGARPTLASGVASSILSQASVTSVRIEGQFAVSIWSWNFTIGEQGVATGSTRSNVQREPATARELTAHTVEQVAQLTFNGGWLEILQPPSAQLYVDVVTTVGTGTVAFDSVEGVLGNGTLVVEGSYEFAQATTDGELYARFARVSGTSRLNGTPVDVPLSDGGGRPGTVVASRAGHRYLPWAAGVAGLMAMAILVHGPMQSRRFRGIQRRFDDRDYLEVLARIDPYTRRRRFRRSANLLKAISLLSLNQFKEAALFLRTLGPLDGPDPATNAFLRACAAAGQAKDADAIAHLTDCFRLDATFKDEARTVPALRRYLPYFDVDAGGVA